MAGKRKLESESPSKSKGRVKWWRERLRQMERIANATPRPIHSLLDVARVVMMRIILMKLSNIAIYTRKR